MDGDLIVGLTCCLIIPLIVAVVVERRYRRRVARRRAEAGMGDGPHAAPEPALVVAALGVPPGTDSVPATDDDTGHILWLLAELERPTVREMVPATVAHRLTSFYHARLPGTAAAAVDVPLPVTAVVPVTPAPAVAPGGLYGQAATAAPAAFSDVFASQAETPIVAAIDQPVTASPPPIRPAAPSPPPPRPWERWDSAVVLLYLGAFLVVAAGLVYSSRNWSDLPGWQKVGLMTLAVVGFTGVGLALLRSPRVRPAAETFVGIGALLVPMDILAAYNFLRRDGSDEALLGPWATLEIGSLLIAGLYGSFAYRPGGLVYRYGAAAAVILALVALPAALGGHWAWGAALVAVGSAAVPDAPRRLRGRLRRFARPAVNAGLVALPAAILAAGYAAFVSGPVWALPLALLGGSATVARLALRRERDTLVALWTVMAAGTLAAALVAADLEPADWTPFIVAAAAAWLAVGERGPALLRRPSNLDLLHVEAGAAFCLAPVLPFLEERWTLLTLALAAGCVGIAALARLRAEPLLGGAAAVAASLSYLSLGYLVPDRIVDAPLPLTLAPGAILVALAALGIAWRTGQTDRAEGLRWSLPVWGVAVVEGTVITLIALRDSLAGGGSQESLILAGVCLGFAAAAAAAVLTLRRPEPLIGGAVWLEIGMAAAMAALPADLERTLPALVLANAGLGGAAALAPLRGLMSAEAETTARRGMLSLFGFGGGFPLVAMVFVTGPYLLEFERPPTGISHPETGWWWPYLGCYAALAALAAGGGYRWARREQPAANTAAIAATLGVAATALLGLRMSYAVIDLGRDRWPGVVVALGGLLGGGALLWQLRARPPFDRGLTQGLAVLGAVLALPFMLLSLASSGAFALGLWDRYPLSWWWPYLGLYLGLIVGARWLGGRSRARGLPVASAAGVLGALVLLLRFLVLWVDRDGFFWLPVIATAALGAIWAAWCWVPAGWPRAAFAGWASGAAAIIAVPAIVSMFLATAAYGADVDPPVSVAAFGETGSWLAFVAFYLAALAGLARLGPRVANTRLAFAATAAATAAAVHGWRMLYGAVPLDGLDWLPLLTGLGALAAAVGLHLRLRGLTRWETQPDPFTMRVGTQAAVVGGVVSAAALAAATVFTLWFILDHGAETAAPFADRPGWWWRFVVFYVVVAAAAWFAGRWTEWRPAVWVTTGYGLLAAWVALRMTTADLPVWTYVDAGVAGVLYLLAVGVAERGRRESPFDQALGETLRYSAAGLVAVAVGGNLLLAVTGRTDDLAETLLYLAVGIGIFLAGLRERLAWFSYVAVVALLPAGFFGVAAAGAEPVNAGYIFAGLGWCLMGGSLAVPRSGPWVGQATVLERSAYGVAALPVLLGLGAEGAFDPGEGAYQRVTLAVASLAGVLALGAIGHRRAIQGYLAATAGLTALLMQIAVTDPANVQAYTVPVAVYLFGLAWVRRRDSRLFDPLAGAAALMLLVPPFVQSFGSGGFAWALLCGAEGLVLVFVGLLVARRTPVAAGVAAITLVVLRQMVDYVNSLPTWAIMAVVGVLLLTLGTLSLLARDAFLRRLDATRTRWEDLR